MNAVQWLGWSPEAFEQARREDKLILLDIGAVWCHWCHVMDKESYGNPDIIKIISERYVPVRVDCDERPDLNDRFNQGGWPTTVILTSEGFVVHGVTYLPPPALRELLEQASEWYDQNRQRVSDAVQVLAAEASRKPPVATPGQRQVRDFTCDIVDNMMKHADHIHGGFESDSKFPQPAAVSLLFAQFFRTAEQGLLEFAEKTLQNMSEGLLDKEEGGLFRYSVTPEWNMPHYEKNLDVNAECLQNYLDAYRLTGKRVYAETAEKIAQYVRTSLSDMQGGFYSSQDSDIYDRNSLEIIMDGETYYALSLSERKNHGAPAIEKTIYVNSNALMISSLLDAYHVLGNEDCHDFALRSLQRLMGNCLDDQLGVCHYLRDGKKAGSGFLGDAVALARANLDAYETMADGKFLNAARRLMDISRKRYAAEDGGFYDSVPEGALPPAIHIRHKPLKDNLLAVEVFGRLYNYTADPAFLELATTTLATFERNVQQLLAEDLGYFAAEHGLVVPYVNDSSTKVAVIGSAEDERSLKLIHEAKRLYHPTKNVQLLDPAVDMHLIKAMNYPLDKELPVVHICTEKGCAPPLREVDEMYKVLIS